MSTKFIVRLTEEERKSLGDVVKKLQSSREKIRRANILLKVDADGLNWNDKLVAEAYDCSRKTVENVRRRFVKNGLEEALNRLRRLMPPTPKKLDGRQEAEIIALRLGVPPEGYGARSLRLLARKAVELRIADSVSHETVRKTLKNGLNARKVEYWVAQRDVGRCSNLESVDWCHIVVSEILHSCLDQVLPTFQLSM